MGRKNRKDRASNDGEMGLGKKKLKEILSLNTQLLEMCSKPSSSVEWQDFVHIRSLVERVRELQKGHVLPKVQREDHFVEFDKWLTESGVDTSKTSIAKTGDTGYGLLATQDIQELEIFLRIPRKMMLTVEAARQSIIGPLVKTDSILKAMPHVALALFLLNEKMNPDSYWAPYINSLPEKYSTPLYFTSDEVQLLKGSPVQGNVMYQYKNIVRQYAYFYKVFQTNPAVVGPLKEQFCFDDYRWAVSTIMTRQNEIPTGQGDQMTSALIPYWDMCNHTNGTFSTDFNIEADCSECYALNNVNKADQVFIYYGPRTNSQLLLNSGFVYPENNLDSLEIKLGISSKDPLFPIKSQLLTKAGLVNGSYHVNIEEPIVDHDLLGFLRIFNMNEEQLKEQIHLGGSRALCDFDCPISKDIDLKAWMFLETRASLLIKCYPTTAEEDEKMLHSRGQLSDNAVLAVLLRLCEKRILHKTVEFAHKMQTSLQPYVTTMD